ncbi:MAG: Lrp/AsnC family transcriptional regulator [Chloroflexi bacterium]|nr:Lrp/AsnC family transcriptional regulator [Chloroflexota bacterium]
MDAKDRQILEVLQRDGRIAHTRLAEIVNLSAPAVLARVRKLEEQGIIKGYQAVVEPERVGNPIISYIGVTLVHHQREPLEQFSERIKQFPQILEAYHLTGGTDYLLKIAVPSIQALEEFLVHHLTTVPGVDKVHTSMVLSPIKTHGPVPIELQDMVPVGRANGNGHGDNGRKATN